MLPIGIITRNRAAYLEMTLRSLSATHLPDAVSVTVFDDASNCAMTNRYYNGTTESLELDGNVLKVWRTVTNVKLPGTLQFSDLRDTGVRVVRHEGAARGVVNASCLAIKQLFEENPRSPGVILLQDDVVFKPDWYSRLGTIPKIIEKEEGAPVGIVAGLKLNKSMSELLRKKVRYASIGITAQCLYVSRTAYDRVFFRTPGKSKMRKKFDDVFRRKVVEAGMWAGCIVPFVCQHIGVDSLVRPGRQWTSKRHGRVGYGIKAPYALASEIRKL